MEVSFKKNYDFELIIEAENVKICEDAEERIYPTTEDGKTNYKGSVIRDVKTGVIEQFASLLEDMIYYREADFDSSTLIKRLFEKLPQDVCDKLIVELKHDYEPEAE